MQVGDRVIVINQADAMYGRIGTITRIEYDNLTVWVSFDFGVDMPFMAYEVQKV